MKLCIVVGARPNFIKAAPLVTAINNYRKKDKKLSYFMVHTGQHYDENMSEVFFKEMGMPVPKYNLSIGSGRHGKMTGEMLGQIEDILVEEKPDMMISIGDTNSTLAGALAAAKLHIPISHIEAGLRMHDKRIAEEINRVITDHLSALLFVPTQLAKDFLLKEGIKSSSILNYGDIMYDAALQFSAVAEKKSKVMKANGLKPKEFILATMHRAENTVTLKHATTILDAFVELSKNTMKVVLPIHPRTKNMLIQHNLLDEYAKHIQIIEPLGYLDMLVMEKNARLIVTDSGGVQKEAFFQRTPCVFLFINTPWPELVELGWNTVCPPKSTAFIVKTVKGALAKKPGRNGLPYGKGNAGDLMVAKIISYLNTNAKKNA